MSSIYISGNDKYFYSNKIKVFPCAYRSVTYDATACLNTEYNFTHLPHTVDKASYIIEFNTTKLICVIQGYYFEIELGDGDFTTLQNKYLNICVASPNPPEGTDFIEGPHLCSWDSSDGVEATLDGKPEGSDYYIFKGLKIGEGALSNGSYQCYAFKLDNRAKLPIMANKIEDSAEDNAGVPISSKFTTETLSATTSISTPSLNVASDKITANSSSLIANVPVTINNTLDVKTGSTSILKAESTKVTINKPTTISGTTAINGTTTIKGATTIENSSSEATDGNLTVAKNLIINPTFFTNGIENLAAFTIGEVEQQDFGNCLCADVEVPLFVKNSLYVRGQNLNIGNTLSVPNITLFGIQPRPYNTSTFTNGILLQIGKTDGKIVVNGLIKASSDGEAGTVGEIFSIDPKTGITAANQINAKVEGTSSNAVNVTTSINDKAITSIFESNGLAVQKASSLTAASSTDSVGNVIVVGNTRGIINELIPKKDAGWTYNIGSIDKTFDIIYAKKFSGNASTADSFSSATMVKLVGDIIGTSENSAKGWTVNTTIQNNAVTETKIKNGEVTNDKLRNNSITIGSNSVALGGSIGTSDKPFIGDLYFGQQSENSANDCSFIIRAGTIDLSENSSNSGLKIKNINQIKVNNSSLKSSVLVHIDSNTNKVYLGSALYGAVIANTSTDATFVIKSAKTSGDMLQINKLSNSGTTSTKVFGVDYEGNVTANTYNATSDRRLKENIIDYKSEKSILDLPVKKFDFIDGPKNQIGCIAQDLKEICPEIVNENEKGYLSIQENKLVYLLLDEVKKLKNEIEELKCR